jgi:hypothetical protein
MAEAPKLVATDFLTILEHPVTPSYLRFSMFHFINNAFQVVVRLVRCDSGYEVPLAILYKNMGH